MRWTVLARNVVAAGLIVFAASPATAQVAVNDAASTAVLEAILAELQSQTTIMNSQLTKMTEIKEVQDDILDAICGRSTLATRVASVADTDFQNFPALGLELVSGGELPDGVPQFSFSDIESIEAMARQLYGIARKAESQARQAQRTVERVRNFDPRDLSAGQVYRIGKQVLKEARVQREHVHISAVEDALAFSAYSRADQTAAKGREVSLSQGRSAAKCLREDVKAMNETNIELTRRINHLIALMSTDVSVKASEALQGLPMVQQEEDQ